MPRYILHRFSYRMYRFNNYADITKATKIYLNTSFPENFEKELKAKGIEFKIDKGA